MHRRAFLASAAGASAAALAGCAGDSGGGGTSPADDATSTAAVETHPATQNLADQPVDGETGGHVIVAFEDPSCPRCGAFHQGTVPKIRSNLIDPGKAAFVYRNWPVVYPWGEPATKALEATLARAESAHWALLDHYFGTQGEFGTDNVLDRTASFLDAETDLEGAAVVDAVEAGEADAAVDADRAAAEAVDLPRSTPQILLFRDGEYETRLSGSASYEAIAAALGE